MAIARLSPPLPLFCCLLAALSGCRSAGVAPGWPVVPTMTVEQAGVTAESSLDDVSKLLRGARAARREGWIAELQGSDRSVDHYYEAVAFAYAGLNAAGVGNDDADCASAIYNDGLADCLRAAVAYGRLDPRSHLTVNTPAGSTVVPVVHHGFVWSSTDFGKLLDACAAPDNPSQHFPHVRAGLGANQVVERINPRLSESDRFLMNRVFFPATAVLRPDLGPWLGRFETSSNPDSLDLYDPIRVPEVDLAGSRRPLAADFGAPAAFAQEVVGSRRYTLTGFFNPSLELKNAALTFIEPFQPGKIPVVFIHGLLDNPYHFTDFISTLQARPGFVERYQIAAFRYPTGNTFLRSAALLRHQLHLLARTFDPSGTDPGLQNTVLVGFSMGGMLTKLQITSSGEEVWNLASNVPLDSLVTSDQTKTLLRDIFYFEPVPFVKRVVFLATPHDGASFPSRVADRIVSPLVRRPSDSIALVAQLRRDNPGAIRPAFSNIPTSVELLTNQPPILEVMRRLPVNPATTYHTILGVGYLPPALANGDGVVPISSARSDGAASEHHIRALHTDICYKSETIAEIERILHLHLDELEIGGIAH